VRSGSFPVCAFGAVGGEECRCIKPYLSELRLLYVVYT
jgi:hypothetical protein